MAKRRKRVRVLGDEEYAYAEALTLMDEKRWREMSALLWRRCVHSQWRDGVCVGLWDWLIDHHHAQLDTEMHPVVLAIQLRKRKQYQECHALLQELDSSAALAERGWLYTELQDWPRAEDCFRRAWEQGHVSGGLGLVLSGADFASLPYTGLDVLTGAAQSGHGYAQYHLGVALEEGWWDAPADCLRAAHHLQLACRALPLPAAERRLDALLERRDCAPWGRFRVRAAHWRLLPAPRRLQIRSFLLVCLRVAPSLPLELLHLIIQFIATRP